MHSPGVPKEARLLNYYVTRLGGQVLLQSKNFMGFSGVSVSAALRSALASTLDSLCVVGRVGDWLLLDKIGKRGGLNCCTFSWLVALRLLTLCLVGRK